MPFDTLEIRISLQKLPIGLTLVAVPLSFVGLYLASQAEASLERTVGKHFRSIAQSESMATSQFINDRVLDVAVLASNPGADGFNRCSWGGEGSGVCLWRQKWRK